MIDTINPGGMSTYNRRTALKLLGGAVTLSGMTTVVAAQEEIIKEKFVIRQADSHQGSSPGTCATNGEWTKFATAARLPDGTTTYRLEDVPTKFEEPIANAFDTWAEVAEIINFKRDSDSGNPVKFEPLAEGVLGRAFVWYRGWPGPQRILEFDITLNTKFEWGNLSSNPVCHNDGEKYNVQDVTTHEVGHVIGLGHTSSEESNGNTMSPIGYSGSTFASTLAEGDKNGAHALYHES